MALISKRNPTTFDTNKTIEGDLFEAVVGDEKQVNFFPRLKIKRWLNEVNFSFGLKSGSDGEVTEFEDRIEYKKGDVTAIFTPQEKSIVVNVIDYIKMGSVDPKQVVAENEMYHHDIDIDKITINRLVPNKKAVYLFGEVPLDYFLDLDKIGDTSIVRADNGHNNPSIFDGGVEIFGIHVPDDSRMMDVIILWTRAIKEVFSEHGVELYQRKPHGLFKFFYEKDGIEQKFYSQEPKNNTLWCYFKFDGEEYQKILDYYKDTDKQFVHHNESNSAHGLNVDFPEIDRNIVDECVDRFGLLIGMMVNERDHTQEENDLLINLGDMLDVDEWKLQGNRNDVRRIETGDGIKFDIREDKKQDSNKLKFSVRVKDLIFIKIPPPTKQDILDGVNMPPNVRNSYEVRHAKKAHHKLGETNYKCGIAFQMPTPYAVDATGKKVWCDLHIPTIFKDGKDTLVPTGEDFIVTVPQDFYNTAVRPLIIDPDVGFTVIGGSNIPIVDNIQITNFATSFEPVLPGISQQEDGVILNMNASVQILSSSFFNYGLYDEGDGVLFDVTDMPLVTQTVLGIGNNSPWAFRQLNIALEKNVQKQNYGGACWAESGGYGASLSYTPTFLFGATFPLVFTPLGIYPDPLTAVVVNRNHSIYYTYRTHTAPVVTTEAVTEIEKDSATANGTIVSTDSINAEERGFVFDTVSRGDPGNTAPGDSDYSNSIIEAGSFDVGAFTGSMTGLMMVTTYFVRAYAKDAQGGFAYGDEVTFTTLDQETLFAPTQKIKKKTGDFTGTHKLRKKIGIFSATQRLKAKTGIFTGTHKIRAKTGVFSPTQKIKKKTGDISPINKFRKKT